MNNAEKRLLWAQILYARLDGREALWDNQGIQIESSIAVLIMHNKAAVTLTRALKGTLAIRHIRTSFHIIDEIKKWNLRTHRVPGKDMLADSLTEALSKIRFEESIRRIGVRYIY